MSKSLFKQPLFYTTVLSLSLLGLIIASYVFGWVTPTASPPAGNLTLTSSQWTSTSTGIYYNGGNVGIGTTTPASPLTVAGVIQSTSGGFKYPDNTTQTSAATGGACIVSGNDIICSGIVANSTGSLSITKNGVTCPIWKDCDGDGKTYGNGDCDESCSTCYVGSTAYTTSPDGKDQDCDGTVDEPTSTTYQVTCTSTYYLFGTTSACQARCVAVHGAQATSAASGLDWRLYTDCITTCEGNSWCGGTAYGANLYNTCMCNPNGYQ